MALQTFATYPGLAWPVKRSALWSTNYQEAISGRASGLGQWSYPKRKYELTFEFLRQAAAFAEWQAMEGFFNSVGGRRDIWQFNDVNDNAVTNQGFGTGDGATTIFQLVRTFGGFTEPVFAVSGAPTIKVAGVTTSVTVNAGGTVTFASAPALNAALTWTGSFYFLCRFDNDQVDFSSFSNALWELKQLNFTTEKL